MPRLIVPVRVAFLNEEFPLNVRRAPATGPISRWYVGTQPAPASPVSAAAATPGRKPLLQSYATRPENTVRWRWSQGDLVLFDNRITQHYAVDDYGDQPRLLHRVTVAGSVPVGVDGRSSYVVTGDTAAHYTPAA